MPDFQALFEAAPGLYLVLTPDLRIVAATDAYLQATMTTREDVLGRGIFDAFPDNPDDPQATGARNLRESLERVLQLRRPDAMAVQKYDVRRPEAEGGAFEVRYWSPLNSPVVGRDGEIEYIIHRVEDVTEFVRLKQAGRESEERSLALATRAEQMEAEVFIRAQEVAEANRQLRAANEAMARLYSQIALLMSQADSELTVVEGEESRWESTQDPINPEEMLGRVGQLIAAHRRMEEQLRQAQKMEAVGQLAGGVAHDFNNLLTVITGYSELMRDSLAPGTEAPELDEIEQAVTRAAALTRKLLAFSRKQVLQPRIVDLNAIVSGTEEMLRRLIGENIQMVTVLGGNLGKIKADPTQIEQVIMNLAVNARDSMPSGGRLIVETKNVSLRAGQVRSLAEGEYVALSVSDTGHGMDEATAARIFEPFFTTKAVGKGTGLGLSTAVGIVEQSGGALTVDSKVGKGTVFFAYLPSVEGAVESEAADRQVKSHVVQRLTVLVVEDEAPLRKLVSTVLEAAGHRVLEAANGEEALAHASQQSIDLVLTDVLMPGMTGPAVVAKLRKERPDLSVLYMSGYDQKLIDAKALAKRASFLPKPFTPRALLAAIEDLQIQAEGYNAMKGQRLRTGRGTAGAHGPT